MTRSLLFVKPARSGSRLQSVLDLYDRWAEEVILRPMKASVISSQEDKPLSRSVIAEFVGNIIKEFKGITNNDDIFYVICPPELSRPEAEIQGTVPMAKTSEIRTKVIGGVLYRQQVPDTYWLSVSTGVVPHVVRLAFCQSRCLQDVVGPTAWMVQKNGPTNPVWTQYVRADEPAFASQRTFATAPTDEVEQEAFAVLCDEIEKSGIPVSKSDREPGGKSLFPDYRVVIANQRWAVEITRPLGAAPFGRTATMGNSRTYERAKSAAAKPGLDWTSIVDSLKQSVENKSAKRKDLDADEKYCLLLVDTIGVLHPYDAGQWVGCELGAFDSVVLVLLEPDSPGLVTAVKGNMPGPFS